MQSPRKTVLCALLGVVLLFTAADFSRAEEPAAGSAPPSGSAPGSGASSSPSASKAEPAAPKARAAKKAKKSRKTKKAGKRGARKKGKRTRGKRPGAAGERDAAPSADERRTPGAEAKSYTIRKGDSLWTIAKKTGVDPDTLVALNDVDPSGLKPGRRLLLEAPPAPEAAEVPAAAPPEAPVSATSVGENGEPAPTVRERVVAAAQKLLDIPYRFGGSTLLGIDCSGYVQKVFGFFGLALPRTAREMFGLGTEISREELSLGDLVFFRTYASFPSHVGIYIGNNMFIHASSRDRKVKVDSLDAPYYLRKFIGAKRLPIEGEAAGN